jgi:hypothetical protein
MKSALGHDETTLRHTEGWPVGTSAALKAEKAVAPAHVSRTTVRQRPGSDLRGHDPGNRGGSTVHSFGSARLGSALAAVDKLSQACPVATPRTCPFGGACHTCPTRVQAKLEIGRPDDEYEREADEVADKVMRMPAPCCSGRPNESEKKIHLKPLSSSSAGIEVSPEVEAQIQSLRSTGGRALSDSERAFFEPRLGHDFVDVRVHADARAAESARVVGAEAYTVGQHLVFRIGRDALRTDEGRRLMAHGLTHVVQQTGRGLAIQRKEKEKAPCAVHAYDNSNPKDAAVIPKSGGIGVSSVADLVSKVNAYVDAPGNSCGCVGWLEINGHGTDGYQSVGNGNRYVNDEKALVHDSKDEHLKQISTVKFCALGLLMLMGCHVGQGKGKTLLSRLSAILPGKAIGGAQHYTAGTGFGGKRVVGAGDILDKNGNVDMAKANRFLTSPFVQWHITLFGREYVINGTEAASEESKTKIKAATRIKMKTPEGEMTIK